MTQNASDNNAINRLPRPRNAGTNFDYSQWFGVNSIVSLHKVPFTADQLSVVYESGGHDGLNAYLQTTPSYRNVKTTFHKMNAPLKLAISYDEALRYNYMHVYNPPVPGQNGSQGKHFYYFINDVLWKAGGTTELVIQLDVWQTFIYSTTFGRVFMEQGHAGIAQLESTDPTGVRFLTVPEGLETGGDYQITRNGSGVNLMRAGDMAMYSVMIVSNTDLEVDGGDVDNPELKTAGGSDWESLPNGANIYIVKTLADFKNIMSGLSEKPWMTQGIMSITVVPTAHLKNLSSWPSATIAGQQVYKPNASSELDTRLQKTMVSWRSMAKADLPERYRHLRKFLTFPYMAIEVSSYAGEPMILKPELWGDDDATMEIMVHLALPAPRVAIYPRSYNSKVAPTTDRDNGEFLNNAVYVSNFPQFSVVNNGYLSAIASQAHGLAQSYKTADWSQNRAQSGAQLGYDQATSGMGLTNTMRDISLDTQTANMNLSNQTRVMRGGVNMIGSAVSGVGSGNIGSAIGGVLTEGANAAIDINNNIQSTNINASNINRSTDASLSNMAYNRDTNKQFADYANKGDYQNTIAQINARTQDTKLTQPTASGGIGGDAFLMAKHKLGVDVKLKMPPQGALERIGEYWLRYGYAVNRFMVLPNDFAVMSNFTYWKLKESYIVDSECPEPYKAALRGILESGVTVYKYAKDIGRIDPAVNTPMYRDYFGRQSV